MREILLPNTCRYFSVIPVAFPSRLLSVSLLLPLFIIFTKDKKTSPRWRVADSFVPLLPADQDGWLGEFFGGQRYPLLWKEGEVYLLPLSEDDIGFYKAPGEWGGGVD